MPAQCWDAIIVGGGPAGLSAALVLGRCGRDVLLLDDERPRNRVSRALHGFLTRDGVSPAEFREISRHQLAAYPSVRIARATADDCVPVDEGFRVHTHGGGSFIGRKLIIATGVVDELPRIDGFEALYGRCVFHCPYCDGWEVRGEPLAAYGKGDRKGAGLALELLVWSPDVVLCTDGPSGLSDHSLERLARHGITVREEGVVRLEPSPGSPGSPGFEILFADSTRLSRRALFFNTGRRQSSDIAARLGCESCDESGCEVRNPFHETNVRGVYIAGDASRDVLQVVVAAAEGAAAAVAINADLVRERLP